MQGTSPLPCVFSFSYLEKVNKAVVYMTFIDYKLQRQWKTTEEELSGPPNGPDGLLRFVMLIA